jgi:hypothetical protein
MWRKANYYRLRLKRTYLRWAERRLKNKLYCIEAKRQCCQHHLMMSNTRITPMEFIVLCCIGAFITGMILLVANIIMQRLNTIERLLRKQQCHDTEYDH